jgi:subtilase family serine protease
LPDPQSDPSRPLPPFETVPEPRREPRSLLKAALLGLCIGVAAGCASNVGTLAPSAHASGVKHDGLNISRALPATSPSPVPAEQAACAPGPAAAACGVVKLPGLPGNTPTGGLTPAQLRSAYGLPAPAGAAAAPGPVIAIIVAFDSASAQQDLNTYRTQFGLPPCSAGCFQKVIVPPTPGDPPPAPAPPGSSTASTWSDERALDLAMASAACPNCRLVLVEAAGQDLDSLSAAVNAAASYNPVAISNSWGVPESGGNAPNIDAGAQSSFDHPGIAITASAGDLGSGAVQFPASSPYVTSVGGTTLIANAASPRGWTETAWIGSGNGCSIMVAVPAWQTAGGSCAGWRSVPDVSMLADSSIGVAVYNTADKGWVVLGGTSIGAPFVAGLYGAASDYGGTTIGAPSLYANLSNLNAVPGTNGSPNGLTGF